PRGDARAPLPDPQAYRGQHRLRRRRPPLSPHCPGQLPLRGDPAERPTPRGRPTRPVRDRSPPPYLSQGRPTGRHDLRRHVSTHGRERTRYVDPIVRSSPRHLATFDHLAPKRPSPLECVTWSTLTGIRAGAHAAVGAPPAAGPAGR